MVWHVVNAQQMALFYFIILFKFNCIFAMVSFWLSILLANNFCPRFFDPSVYCPSSLEHAVFFLAVTLAALRAWLCCLQSSHLSPPWRATASQVGSACYYLMKSAKPLLTYLDQKRQAALLTNKGIDVPPQSQQRHSSYGKMDSLTEKITH